MVIDEPLKVLPRPEHPVETGDEQGWLEFSNAFGIIVPRDYREFIAAYGIGEINGWLKDWSSFG